MEFQIRGIVREKESGTPVPGLLVRAFDKDLFFTDVLGNAITSPEGTFALGYERKDFKDLFEHHPDIFFHVYGRRTAENPGLENDNPIFSSINHIRFNASPNEFIIIEIPRNQLGEDAPEGGQIHTPAFGEWKEQIDKYIQDNPIDFQFDPDKGFMAPKLEIQSNLFPEVKNFVIGKPHPVTLSVANKGNGISFSTKVQLFIGYGSVTINSPLRDYTLSDEITTTVNPMQTKELQLKLMLIDVPRLIVGVCYDLFLDPRGFSTFDPLDRYHDHVTLFIPPVFHDYGRGI